MGEWKTKRDFALFRSSGRSQSRDLSSGKKKSFNSEAATASVEVVEDCIASGRKMELDKEWHGFARHVEEISCEEAGGDTSNGLGPGQDQSSDVETSSSELRAATGPQVPTLHTLIFLLSYSQES